MVDRRVVRARSRHEVEEIAEDTRLALGLDLEGRVSMTPLLEQVLYDLIEDYDFQVEDDQAMGDCDGLTDCHRPIIKMKHSVYLGLQRGEPRPRMTAAHEFGHLVMHCGLPTYHPFSTEYDPLVDPERQANIFAAAFLMPRSAFRRCLTVSVAMRMFGVSRDAALKRARHLRHKIADDGAKPLLAKRKGRKLTPPTP